MSLRNRYFARFLLGSALVLSVSAPLALQVHAAWGLIGAALTVALGALCFSQMYKDIRAASEAVEKIMRGEAMDEALLTQEGDLNALVSRLSLLADRLTGAARRHDQDRQAMKRFVEDVSHQLKTPLSALRLSIEARQLHDEDPTLSQCLLHIDRMTFLIQSLLKLARLEAGAVQMSREDALLRLTAESAAEALLSTLTQRGQRVLITGDLDAHVRHDPRWLREALENILKNACEHSPKGAQIRVILEGCEDGARIRIRDAGDGIRPAALAQLFDRFYRAPDSKSTSGVGIGLPLAKLIVDAHRGDLSARNMEDGGAEFVIRLWDLPGTQKE